MGRELLLRLTRTRRTKEDKRREKQEGELFLNNDEEPQDDALRDGAGYAASPASRKDVARMSRPRGRQRPPNVMARKPLPRRVVDRVHVDVGLHLATLYHEAVAF